MRLLNYRSCLLLLLLLLLLFVGMLFFSYSSRYQGNGCDSCVVWCLIWPNTNDPIRRSSIFIVSFEHISHLVLVLLLLTLACKCRLVISYHIPVKTCLHFWNTYSLQWTTVNILIHFKYMKNANHLRIVRNSRTRKNIPANIKTY